MTKQEMTEMLENHLVELSQMATEKQQMLKSQLMAKLTEVAQYREKIATQQAVLEQQLIATQAELEVLDKPLRFETSLEELVNEGEEVEELKRQLTEQFNQQVNQLKAEYAAVEQALSDQLNEVQAVFMMKSSQWEKYKLQFEARFGEKTQRVKVKFAEQLEKLAARLKA